MNHDAAAICPKCSAPILAGAPHGLCPRCVFMGLTTEVVLAPSGPVATVEEIAAHFPDLEVLEMLGAGGMGAVYKARQPKLDRLVALKVLKRELADHAGFLERFSLEGRLLARLHHAHIVTIFDTGTAGPFVYLLMEFVDGVNLHEAMQEGRFTPEESLRLVQDICAGLHFAHEKGVLHRDIKPANLLIDTRGQIKIADFGIAKLFAGREHDQSTLTEMGMAVGTPNYMAPEQCELAEGIDQRADLYSLGVVMYELLTGELPRGHFLPPSAKVAMDPRIDAVVMRCLAQAPAARFQSVSELRTHLEDILQGRAPVEKAAGIPLSTYAAVCTGTSLALGVLGVAFFMLMLDRVRSNELRDSVLYMVLAVELVLVGVPAVLGMLFGWRVLGELRRSRGEMPGLDTALMGALSWPLIGVFIIVGITLWEIVQKGYPPLLSLPLFVVLSLVLGAVPAGLLSRWVFRWVRGGTAAAKPSSH